MTLSKKQSEDIKIQLLKQIEHLPQENQEELRKYISSLNPEQLEEFLKKQGIDYKSEPDTKPANQCVFCSIVQGGIPSHRITEENKAIAILEINPLSKGHSIILPKEHISTEKIPNSVLSLAKKIAKKIKSKLKPEDVKIETSSFQNHAFVNVIPIYKDGKLEKRKASEEELKSVLKKLQIKKRAPRKKKEVKKSENKTQSESKLPKLSFRIP